MDSDQRHELGRQGEKLAEEHVRKLGYRILERNHKTQLGEIDIIALHGSQLVFLEVKTRSNLRDRPAEAVTREKRRRITRLALQYVKKHNMLQCAVRFDIIAVTWPRNSQQPRLEHETGAFEGETGPYELY